MAFASIKDVLVGAALVSPQQYEQWRSSARADNPDAPLETPLDALRRISGLPEPEFLKRLAGALGWPYRDRVAIAADMDGAMREEVLSRVSTKIAFQHTVMPLAVENGHVLVAVNDPFDPAMLGAVQFEATAPVQFVLAPAAEIERALKESYGVGAETLDQMADDTSSEIEVTTDKEIADGDQEASVIKFVNQIIWEAHSSKATDIHLEPMEDQFRIRYRIDGILHSQPMPEQLRQRGRVKHYQAAIISRVKVMSGMNIAERRLPQDGRINVRIKGEELDIRVSTVPTVYGESVSLRLLSRGKASFNIRNLGLSEEQQRAIEKIIVKPHGIFLVTGPTGSGKSTSLYAFLTFINNDAKRILTVEEPVEYEIKGVNQIAVRPEIGLSFAVGLRHILRQDPNVVMVGEVRDLETAEIAIRAALTGHLVFSTLHTNDAPSAFTRLIDMGIEPFLVASSVEAVMAQRLVRTICPRCREPQKLEHDYLRKIGFPEERIDTAEFWRGPGCDSCRQLGYQGRTGIYELLVMTDEVRPLVMNRTPASSIAQMAIEQGMRTLRMDGWRKTDLDRITRRASGELIHEPTTIEEVLRVTQSEEHLSALMEER